MSWARVVGGFQKGQVFLVLVLAALELAACATPGAMTVSGGAATGAGPKYRSAIAVRSVSGGQAVNVLLAPGVANEPLKEALENTLGSNGYLARTGAPKYYLDAEIRNLDQPLIGLDLDVTADVTYKLSGGGTEMSYPIKTTGHATLSDSVIAADRLRIANERAMRQNIEQLLLVLR